MADEEGAVRTVTVAELVTDPQFEIPAAVPSRGARPGIGLEGLPAAAVEEASWWEAHIAEVVYGLRPDAPAGTRPRPQYDPERTSLTERERAKAAELSAAGRPVHGQHGQAPPPAVGGARPGRARRPPVGPADAARTAGPTSGSSMRCGRRSGRRRMPPPGRRASSIWRTREILAEAGDDGPRAVGPDVLPAVRHAVARPARDGIGIHPPVAGRPAEGHVRVTGGGGTRRGRADRLHPAGRPGAAGRRGPWPGRDDRR